MIRLPVDPLETRQEGSSRPRASTELAERLGVPARHLTRMLNRLEGELTRAGIRYTRKRIGGGPRRVTLIVGDNNNPGRFAGTPADYTFVKAHAA